MNLRPYQIQAISDICQNWHTHNRVLFQAPTGSGKTEIAKQIIINSGVKTLFVVHRKELLEQNLKVFADAPNVDIAMVQTISRRKIDLHDYKLVVIDEAHHASTKSYDACMNGNKILGLTATPRRLDGKPLNDRFDVLVQGPTIQSLIEEGYLAIPEIFVPPATAKLVEDNREEWKVTAGDYNKHSINQFFEDNKKVIYGDVIEHYKQLCVDNPTIVFCPSVKSVYETVSLFKDNDISAYGIDGSLPLVERQEIVSGFRNGDFKCIMSCDLISEGFDMPDAYAAIMLRPTKSLTVYLQQAGRVLRMKDDKHKCIIIDHVNNTSHFGPPWIQRYWSLDGYTKRTRVDTLSGINLKLCLKCGNYVQNNCIVCPICGNPFKQKSKAFKVIYEDLQKITIESQQKLIEQTVQKILDKEKYKMQKRDKSYYLEKAVEWNIKEDHNSWAEKKLAQDKENTRIYFEGTRDELITMFSKRKNCTDPVGEADKALAKRNGKKSNPVFETGTLEEIADYVRREAPYNDPTSDKFVKHPELFAKGVMKNRLAPVFVNGTEDQKAEATILTHTKKDRYGSMYEFAKSGKVTPRDEATPRVLTDEEADKFAKAVVRKDNKSVIDTGTKEQLLSVAEQMHIPAERRESWANTVLAGRK